MEVAERSLAFERGEGKSRLRDWKDVSPLLYYLVSFDSAVVRWDNEMKRVIRRMFGLVIRLFADRANDIMPLASLPIPLELQVEIMKHALSVGVRPTTLMTVCQAWKEVVYPEIYRAQAVCNSTLAWEQFPRIPAFVCKPTFFSDSPAAIDRVISHFAKSGSRSVYFSLLEAPRQEHFDWRSIERLSDAFFVRVRALGVLGNGTFIRGLISRFGSTLVSLEELSVCWIESDGLDGPVLDVSTLVNLRVIRLKGGRRLLGEPRLELGSAFKVTHLELSDVILDPLSARRLITSCVQLKSCILQVVGVGSPALSTPWVSGVEYLHIFSNCEISEMFVGGRFPKLLTLSVGELLDLDCKRRRSVFSVLSPVSMPVLVSLSVTVALFDVDYIHLLATIPTLLSVNLPYISNGTEIEHIWLFLTALVDVRMLPLLRDVSVWLRYSSRACKISDVFETRSRLDRLFNNRRGILRRLFVSLPGLTVDWDAGEVAFPPDVYMDTVYDCPEWTYRLWPHHPKDVSAPEEVTWRIGVPFLPNYPCVGRARIRLPMSPGWNL
ncbi:hypothetical protein BDN72DRAFT_861099 [Pluteus cervinus]|uniref:Uncharacterized protein n=1 Tax=Pluteus cervinus TaxID=181527 RepID=A0ACD3AGR9_9AGAR|nr:hypothetical protein BDN72DRAFT_861099 [Pluteus cervinus]